MAVGSTGTLALAHQCEAVACIVVPTRNLQGQTQDNHDNLQS